MKKAVFLVTLAVVLAMSAALAGCGGSNNVSNNSSSNSVSMADLGVPIYPGAVRQEMTNNGQRPDAATGATPPPGSQTNSSGQSSMPWPPSSAPQPPGGQPDFSGQNGMPGPGPGNMTALWSADSTGKVAAWYKEQLYGKSGFAEATPPGPQGSNQSSTSVMYTFKSGDTTKSVMIRENAMDGKGGTTITIGDLPARVPSSPPATQGR